MSTYIHLIDAFTIFIFSNIPEKWQKYWEEVYFTRKQLILFEPLISEILYKYANCESR